MIRQRKYPSFLYITFVVAGFFLNASTFSQSADNQRLPKILIFNGLPGDEAHHQFFEKNLSEIRNTLLHRFKIPEQRISIYYGPKEAGYAGPATRENVLAALKNVQSESDSETHPSPVWLIFQGHANRIPGGANLNLPGPDLSTKDLARALKDFPEERPLVIIATTAAASDFLKALSGKHRIIIAASGPRDPVTEPEFPSAFSSALAAKETDTNGDGKVSTLELYLATKQKVIQMYEENKYMIREHTQLDGNGDGQGTQRPAEEDAALAKEIAFIIPEPSKFE